jgi:hypothetical protein
MNLCMHLDLMMSHFMLLRSQNRLDAELDDFFTVTQSNESSHEEINMLFLLLRQNKIQLGFIVNADTRHNISINSSMHMSFEITLSIYVWSLSSHFISDTVSTFTRSNDLSSRMKLSNSQSDFWKQKINLNSWSTTLTWRRINESLLNIK